MIQVERTDFVGIPVTDRARAVTFYGETLGLKRNADPSSSGQPFAPSPAGLALRVPDVDAARAELEAKGVQFDGETIETSVCRQAWFKDPDGNALMLHRRFDV